jgi:hypothetical protein
LTAGTIVSIHKMLSTDSSWTIYNLRLSVSRPGYIVQG